MTSLLRNKRTILNSFFYIIILGYFLGLVSLISPARYIEPDFFQYVSDSTYYLQFRLPPFIQSLPANPILIGTFSTLFSSFVNEVEVALMINAISASGAFFILYTILKEKVGLIQAGVAMLFLMLHPILFLSATSINSGMLFSFFSICMFYLFWKKRFLLICLGSALGILIRYESILLFLSLFSISVLKRDTFISILKRTITFSIPGLIILSVLLGQNHGATVTSNPFLVEIAERSEDIPELRFIANIPFAIIYNNYLLHTHNSDLYLIPACMFWIGIFLIISKSKIDENELFYFSLLFSLSFLMFHIFFPAYAERYFVPTIFGLVFSFALFVKKLTIRYQLLILVVLTGVIFNNYYFGIHPVLFGEYRITDKSPDYLTAQSIKKFIDPNSKYLLVSPYPQTLQYYYRDTSNIEFISVRKMKSKTDCTTVECALDKLASDESTFVLIPFNNVFYYGLFLDHDAAVRKWHENIGLFELGDYLHSDNSCVIHQETSQKDQFNLVLYQPC